MHYEVVKSSQYPGHWNVEAIDNDGRVFVAIFSDQKRRNAHMNMRVGRIASSRPPSITHCHPSKKCEG